MKNLDRIATALERIAVSLEAMRDEQKAAIEEHKKRTPDIDMNRVLETFMSLGGGQSKIIGGSDP